MPRLPTALLAAALAASGASHARAPTEQAFDVRVDLVTPAVAATCAESTLPGPQARVKIACAQPKSPPRSPTHLLLHIFRADEWVGTVDGLMATGTVTSWRFVRLAQREYLEMTVGW